MSITTLTQPYIRFSIGRDVPAIIAIDEAQFADPLSHSDFVTMNKQLDTMSMVIEYDEHVVGYMLYELHPGIIRLLRLAVHPRFERTSVGTLLLDKLKTKLGVDIGYGRLVRERIDVSVPDDNLPAHLWLRANGFTCHDIEQRDGVDFYFFCFKHA